MFKRIFVVFIAVLSAIIFSACDSFSKSSFKFSEEAIANNVLIREADKKPKNRIITSNLSNYTVLSDISFTSGLLAVSNSSGEKSVW